MGSKKFATLLLTVFSTSAFAGEATTVGTFKNEDVIFEVGGSVVANTGIQKSSEDEQGIGRQMSILLIGKGETGDVRLAASIGKVMDRMIGSYYVGGWQPRKHGVSGGMDTTGELTYQTNRFDVYNAGVMIPTPEGGTLKLVALLASLHADRENTYAMFSHGLRVTFEQEIGEYFRAYAGGVAAILYNGDESAETTGEPLAIVLTKPGVKQDGIGTYYQAHLGFATKMFSNLVFDASMMAEKTSYEVYEYGIDRERLGPNEERGSFAVTGRVGAALHF